MVLRIGFMAMVLTMGLWACSGDEEKTSEPVSPDQAAAAATPDQPGVENAGETPAKTDAAQPATAQQPAPEQPAAAPATPAAAQGKMEVTAGMLNVRSGPGMSHKVVRHVKKGETVTVLSQEGNWVKISEGEYVSKKYLK